MKFDSNFENFYKHDLRNIPEKIQSFPTLTDMNNYKIVTHLMDYTSDTSQDNSEELLKKYYDYLIKILREEIIEIVLKNDSDILFPESGDYNNMQLFYVFDNLGNITIDRDKFKSYLLKKIREKKSELVDRYSDKLDQIIDIHRLSVIDCKGTSDYIKKSGNLENDLFQCNYDDRAVEYELTDTDTLVIYKFNGIWLMFQKNNSDQKIRVNYNMMIEEQGSKRIKIQYEDENKSTIQINLEFRDEAERNRFKKDIDHIKKKIHKTFLLSIQNTVNLSNDFFTDSENKFKDCKKLSIKSFKTTPEFKDRKYHYSDSLNTLMYFDRDVDFNQPNIYKIRGIIPYYNTGNNQNVVEFNDIDKLNTSDFNGLKQAYKIKSGRLIQYLNSNKPTDSNFNKKGRIVFVDRQSTLGEITSDPYIYVFFDCNNDQHCQTGTLDGGGAYNMYSEKNKKSDKTYNVNQNKLLELVNFFSPYDYKTVLDIPFFSYIYFQKQKNPYYLAIYYSILDGDHSCEKYIVQYINHVFQFPKDLYYHKLNQIPKFQYLIILFYKNYNKSAHESDTYIHKVIKRFVKKIKKLFIQWCERQALLLLDNKNRDLYSISGKILTKKEIQRYIWICANYRQTTKE